MCRQDQGITVSVGGAARCLLTSQIRFFTLVRGVCWGGQQSLFGLPPPAAQREVGVSGTTTVGRNSRSICSAHRSVGTDCPTSDCRVGTTKYVLRT
jgi:hypothetical protein